MSYLARFLDKTDHTASLRHAAYALVVLFSCVWLSWDLVRGPINSEWVASFALLLGAVTTSKIVGAAASSGSGGPLVSGGCANSPTTEGEGSKLTTDGAKNG